MASNMKFMEITIRWSRICGVYERVGENPHLRTLRRFSVQFFALFTVVPCVAFIFTQENYFTIAQTLYSVFMFTGMSTQLVIMGITRKKLTAFLDNVHSWVKKVIRMNGTTTFERVEKRLSGILGSFVVFTTISAIFYVLAPAVLVAQAYITGTVSESTFDPPFHDIYGFKTNFSPVYEFFYIMYSIGVFADMAIFFTKDFLFVGVCLYVVGLYDELKWLIRTIDDQRTSVDRVLAIRRCVQFHNVILTLCHRWNGLFSLVIFVQLAYSLCTMAMLVFTATYVDFAHLAVLCMNACCLCGELFMFCWTGSMVLDETGNVNYTLYDLRWYEYTANEQKMVLMMLLRNERPVAFKALNFFVCNLETFQYIMSKVFASFTFLQGMA